MTPWRAGILMAIFGLGVVALVAYVFFPTPRARFEMVMDDGKTVVAYACSQPGTPAEAESRAQAAHSQLNAQTKAAVDRAATEMQQAMQTANADSTIPTEIDEIYDRLKVDSEAILTLIEAEFDCIPQSMTAP